MVAAIGPRADTTIAGSSQVHATLTIDPTYHRDSQLRKTGLTAILLDSTPLPSHLIVFIISLQSHAYLGQYNTSKSPIHLIFKSLKRPNEEEVGVSCARNEEGDLELLAISGAPNKRNRVLTTHSLSRTKPSLSFPVSDEMLQKADGRDFMRVSIARQGSTFYFGYRAIDPVQRGGGPETCSCYCEVGRYDANRGVTAWQAPFQPSPSKGGNVLHVATQFVHPRKAWLIEITESAHQMTPMLHTPLLVREEGDRLVQTNLRSLKLQLQDRAGKALDEEAHRGFFSFSPIKFEAQRWISGDTFYRVVEKDVYLCQMSDTTLLGTKMVAIEDPHAACFSAIIGVCASSTCLYLIQLHMAKKEEIAPEDKDTGIFYRLKMYSIPSFTLLNDHPFPCEQGIDKIFVNDADTLLVTYMNPARWQLYDTESRSIMASFTMEDPTFRCFSFGEKRLAICKNSLFDRGQEEDFAFSRSKQVYIQAFEEDDVSERPGVDGAAPAAAAGAGAGAQTAALTAAAK